MKATHAVLPLLLTAAGLVGGHAASRPEVAELAQEKSALELRVEALERVVAEQGRRLDLVAAESAGQRGDLEQTVDYLRRQAGQAEDLLRTLDESEDAGFTAGINPRSRELLLAGFRAAASEAQVGLPGDAPEPAPVAR